MVKNKLLAVGLMSGTSMDGIDAALIKTDGRQQIESLGHCFLPYDPEFKLLLKSAEYAVKQSAGDFKKAKQNYFEHFKKYLLSEVSLQPDAKNIEKFNRNCL